MTKHSHTRAHSPFCVKQAIPAWKMRAPWDLKHFFQTVPVSVYHDEEVANTNYKPDCVLNAF